MKALAAAMRAYLDVPSTRFVCRRLLSVSAKHDGTSIRADFDQELLSSFSSPDLSKLQTRLAELKDISSKNPGSKEVVNFFESILSKVYENYLKNGRQRKHMVDHPIAQIVHATIREAVTLKHWMPTKKRSYRTLLKLSPDPETAEEWLRLQQSNCTAPLDRHDFTAVIQAWARSDRPGAAEKAEVLIMELRAQYEATRRLEVSMKPTEAAYIGWITCLSKVPDKIAGAVKAARVLEDILQRAEKDHFRPSIKIYNAVMHVWAKAGQPQNAELMLRDLCEKAFDSGSCMPDQISFTTVIDAWAKSGRPEAPDRGEEVLALLQQFSDFCFQRTARPNAITLTAVMNCWAKSSRKEAPDRAEAILRRMIRSYKDGDPELRPSLVSFNTCMNAWAQSGHASSPEEVERLCQDLIDFGLQPDSATFMARINAWASVRRRDEIECADRALEVFEELVKAGVSPSEHHYNRVMVTLSRCSDGHRAQALLDHMIKNSQPTMFSYHCVLSAWARQCSVQGASQCERILNFMEEKDIVSYNTAIGAWAKSKSHLAMEKAEELLQQILDAKLRPNSFTLSPLCRLLSESPLSIEEKRHKSQNLLKLAELHGVSLHNELMALSKVRSP